MAATTDLFPIKTQFSDDLQDSYRKISLLPRPAWNSQITHLKVLLKTKQILNSRKYDTDTRTSP